MAIQCAFSLYSNAKGDVTSFNLQSGSESLSGASVSLICTLDGYTDNIFIFSSDNKTNVGRELSKCDQTKCRNVNPAYNFTITGNTIEISIKSLQRAADQKWWTCRTFVSQTQSSEKQFQLTVYSEYDKIYHIRSKLFLYARLKNLTYYAMALASVHPLSIRRLHFVSQ